MPPNGIHHSWVEDLSHDFLFKAPSNGSVALILEPFQCDRGCATDGPILIYRVFADPTTTESTGLHRIFSEQPYINGDGKIEMQILDTFFGQYTFSIYGQTDTPSKGFDEQYSHRTPLIAVNFICGYESFTKSPGTSVMTTLFTVRRDV